MNIVARCRAALALLVVALGLTAVPAATAYASPAAASSLPAVATSTVAGDIGILATCTSSRVCLYENSNFGGCRLEKNGSDPTFVDDNPCGWSRNNFNDDTSSAWNRESITVTLCGDVQYKGGVTDIFTAGEQVAQVAHNDTASSLYYGITGCR